jgi:hypothetical protein
MSLQTLILNFLIYEENLIFLFISAQTWVGTVNHYKDKKINTKISISLRRLLIISLLTVILPPSAPLACLSLV